MVSCFICQLTGGLGNQMFQYALGRVLSMRTGAELLFDVRSLKRDPLRSYALGGMRVTGRIAEPRELPIAWGRVTRRAPWVSRLWGGTRLVAERGFPFDASVLQLRPPVALHGNWQSERYFTEQAAAIRADFALAAPLTPEREQIAQQIRSASMPVSVHVRRGDYVNNPATNAYHGTCEPAWYAAAKRALEERLPQAAQSYFVFSDDPDWAQRNLPEFEGATFVAPSADGRDEQDLHLMALCHHHIIANSSFSWWGAWLAKADQRH